MAALVWVGGSLGLSVGLSGCKDYGSQPLPSGTVSPSFYHTPSGAYGLRTQALADLESLLPHYVTASGLLTDELQSNTIGANPTVSLYQRGVLGTDIDARVLPEHRYGDGGSGSADADYSRLQAVRAELGQARAAIVAYDTGAKAIGDPKVMRAQLFALEGYTEILLADLFCSGVPLSTLDFQGDYTYHASSTTDQVYQDAISKEDSALALADTSVSVQNLARVLKGRALLARNDAATAAQVVAPVPDGFQYQLSVNFRDLNAANPKSNQLNDVATVGNLEGQNGLPYLADPRTTVTVTFQPGALGNTPFVPLTFPSKYSYTGFGSFVVASGVEARLIQAEAALRVHDASWLTALNTLRTDGTYTGILPPDTIPPDTLVDTLGVTGCFNNNERITCTSKSGNVHSNDPDAGQPLGYPPPGYILVHGDTTYPAPLGIQETCRLNSDYDPCSYGDSMVVFTYVRPQQVTPPDTLWHAGTGGVNRLGPLADPGTGSANPDSARVALLFRERAFWLFLTGERQGDLRRLLRQYSQWFRRQDLVYPTGRYTGYGTLTYGSDVTAPIPGAEDLNPLFHGCLDRNP